MRCGHEMLPQHRPALEVGDPCDGRHAKKAFFLSKNLLCDAHSGMVKNKNNLKNKIFNEREL